MLMRTLKINWLRTGLVLSFFLLIGAFWVVKAMEKKEEAKVEKKVLEEEVWFDYTSSSTTPSDYNISTNYHLAGDGTEEPDCPEGDDIRCAVKAKRSTSNPNQPDMSTVVASRNRAQ
ncbi:hypothetical protein [Sphingobacterium sp. HSC-15S19]|uniref:hypothetical protein n=1 Tax=Sphingobacterium sp. HSC-15S19 TaxID=2910971 RepID=UPI003D1E85DA